VKRGNYSTKIQSNISNLAVLADRSIFAICAHDGFPFALRGLILFALSFALRGLILFALPLGLILLNLNLEVLDSISFFPVIIYSNLEIDKAKIFSDNKGKAGIYQFINKINGKSYIGSAVDLRRRLKYYFSESYLRHETLKQKSKIYRSLLKNGYENFIIEILEYCPPEECIERENYYLKKFKPD
jgi:hypothetical protein